MRKKCQRLKVMMAVKKTEWIGFYLSNIDKHLVAPLAFDNVLTASFHGFHLPLEVILRQT